MSSRENVYQTDHTAVPKIFTLIQEHRNDEAMRYLQEYPLQIQLKGWMDMTPLHIAAQHGNLEMAAYLVEHGADVNARRTGVYPTPLCWAANASLANYLLDKGAILYGGELQMPTRDNRVDVVDLLLSKGTAIRKQEPEYLNCTSTDCLQVYINHGIDLNGHDEYGSTLLHKASWEALPQVFDLAYRHGCKWTKDSSRRTPYTLARQGRREAMVAHIQTHYAALLVDKIEAIDIVGYRFEYTVFVAQVPEHPNVFIGLTDKGKLVKYTIDQGELQISNIVKIDVPTIRNFAFNKTGDMLIPTTENHLLVVSAADFELRGRIALPEQLELDQITFLPGRNVYIGSSSHFEIAVLRDDFTTISHVKTRHGTLYLQVNQDEDLISFVGYDQETFHNLYHLPDNVEPEFVRSFYKDGDGSCGFGFNGHEFAVSYPNVLHYCRITDGKIEKLWEIDVSVFPSKHNWNYLVFATTDLIVLGKGKTLLYIDLQQQKIVREQTLPLRAQISRMFLDSDKKNLIVATNKELMLLPLK